MIIPSFYKVLFIACHKDGQSLYPYFTDGKTEVWVVKMTYPAGAVVGTESRSPESDCSGLSTRPHCLVLLRFLRALGTVAMA